MITSGYRHTDLDDFPRNVRAVLDRVVPRRLVIQATRIGPAFGRLVRGMLEPHAFLNMRRARGLVRLAKKHSPHLVEQAATVALKEGPVVTRGHFRRIINEITSPEQRRENR